MPNIRKPRKGSLQYWPRRRSKKGIARVRSWPESKEAKLLGFAGYKVGMTHLLVTDNRPNSITKDAEIFMPVTVVECPAIKVLSINFYKKTPYGLTLSCSVLSSSVNKELNRVISLPKNIKKKIEDIKEFDDLRIVIYTQPHKTGFGKKKPDIFEIGIGGSKEEKLNYVKTIIGKEISVKDILKEGQQIDIHAITKGKGTQGPMKRFGISKRRHKSEKSVRNPGSLGPWKGQGHIMWTVAHAGKTGYYVRSEKNKHIIKIGDKAEEINSKGGFLKYGIIKNPYILVKGSIPGAVKRLIRLTEPIRPNRKIPVEAPAIKYTSLESKQG